MKKYMIIQLLKSLKDNEPSLDNVCIKILDYMSF